MPAEVTEAPDPQVLTPEEQLFTQTWKMLLDETERSVERYLEMLAELGRVKS